MPAGEITRGLKVAAAVAIDGDRNVTSRHDRSPAGEMSVVAVGRRGPRRAASSVEPAVGAAAGENGDDVDGLGDQRARHGDDGFLDELLEAAQRAERGAGMDGADAAGMAGAPGLEQIERLGAAHLADRNAVGPQPQRGAHEVGQRGDAVLGAQRHEVRRRALQLARILDQHHAVGRSWRPRPAAHWSAWSCRSRCRRRRGCCGASRRPRAAPRPGPPS